MARYDPRENKFADGNFHFNSTSSNSGSNTSNDPISANDLVIFEDAVREFLGETAGSNSASTSDEVASSNDSSEDDIEVKSDNKPDSKDNNNNKTNDSKPRKKPAKLSNSFVFEEDKDNETNEAQVKFITSNEKANKIAQDAEECANEAYEVAKELKDAFTNVNDLLKLVNVIFDQFMPAKLIQEEMDKKKRKSKRRRKKKQAPPLNVIDKLIFLIDQTGAIENAGLEQYVSCTSQIWETF